MISDDYIYMITIYYYSAVDSGGAGGARAPPEFGGSEKGQSLISAYRSLAPLDLKSIYGAAITYHPP